MSGELVDGGEVPCGVQQVPYESLPEDESLPEVVGETSFTLASQWRLLTIL